MSTPAERQKAYRERLKRKAEQGNPQALKTIEKNKTLQKVRNYKSHAKTYLTKYANREELKEFKKIIQKRLDS